MQYLLLFLEGLITFISPCLLPMIQIYISYFAGEKNGNSKIVIKNALGFSLGFTIIFVVLGAFAGSIGYFLRENSTIVNIVTGIIVIIFGINYLGIINIKMLNKTKKIKFETKNLSFFKSILFGIVFSIGWTPCVGAFLGSALLVAAQGNSPLVGMSMLFVYSIGLSIPFIISAILIDKLKTAFDFIKKNYKIINIISGVILIILGILMVTGYMQRILTVLSI